MIATVLGTGPTVQYYKPDDSVTYGVNDIFAYHHVDNLLVVDQPWSFKSNERVKIIENSTPKQFYSQLDYWKQFFPNVYNHIKLAPVRGEVDLHAPEISYSFDSTFIAIVLAYKHGAKKITTFGVDFLQHPRLSRHEEKIINNYKKLKVAFDNEGIEFIVGHPDSRLSKVWKQYSYS